MGSFNTKFVSEKQDWITPKHLFDHLNREFNFTTDLAASKENALCLNYFTKEQDGLRQRWFGSCWLNPPYGDSSSKLSDWVKRAYELTKEDESLTVVMLIPARTNTNWFHRYCMKAAEVRFLLGRPKFGAAKHGLPCPLALIVFRKNTKTIFKSFNYSHTFDILMSDPSF